MEDLNSTVSVEPIVHEVIAPHVGAAIGGPTDLRCPRSSRPPPEVAAMSQWIDAMAAHDVRDGARRLLRAGGHEIALFCVGERVHALADSCPHQGASLVTGKLDGGAVSCRAHGLRFDLATGCMRGGPGFGVRVYPVRLHDGRVQIDVAP